MKKSNNGIRNSGGSTNNAGKLNSSHKRKRDIEEVLVGNKIKKTFVVNSNNKVNEWIRKNDNDNDNEDEEEEEGLKREWWKSTERELKKAFGIEDESNSESLDYKIEKLN